MLFLQFRQRSVGLLACDLLFALLDHAPVLLTRLPTLPARVVRVLAHVLGALGPNAGSLGASLAIALGEWVMRIPLDGLMAPAKPAPLLLSVLTVGDYNFFSVR